MSSKTDAQRMEKIVSLCKRRGFIFQSSEIYGGLNGVWDYGPLGTELKRNLKDYWWRVMVHERDDVVGMDGAILTSPAVLKASGHVDTFSDPMVDCLVSGKRFRADQVPPETGQAAFFEGAIDLQSFRKLFEERNTPERSTAWSRPDLAPSLREVFDNMSHESSSDGGYVRFSSDSQWAALRRLAHEHLFASFIEQPFSALGTQKGLKRAIQTAQEFYKRRGINSPVVIWTRIEVVENTTRYNPENGSLLTEPRPFNLMFSTQLGASADPSSTAYLRPETAQSIFLQFKNVLEVSRKKLPFGIAQIGKAFRNEINPRNFTFRSREFEQMELEYFCRPEQGMELLEYWKEERLKFYEGIGIRRERLHLKRVSDEERAFYSKGTYDIEYEFPFGVQELEGVAYRTDYDLRQHQNATGKPLEYFDEETKERFIPHVVEPSAGVDRAVLALICDAYDEDTAPDEKGKMESRVVLRFHPRIAPIKAAIFPLLKNKPLLVAKAREVQSLLRPHLNVFYDEAGAIGRRYRRQDEIGTPFGVTIDFETLGEKGEALRDTVTLRERDSMKQERVKISELVPAIFPRVN